MSEPTDKRAVFQYRGYIHFQIARFLAVIAAEMLSVAVGWQLYEITHRPLDLGLAGLAQFLPAVLLFLVAGHAADVMSRKHIVAATFIGNAICATALLLATIKGLTSPHPIYVVLVVIGVMRAFFGPAQQSFLPLLVPEEHFPTAVAWGSSIFNTASILGPTIGGIVYAWTGGPKTVYAAAVIAFICSAVLILGAKVVRPQVVRATTSLENVFAGFRYVWNTKVVLGATSLDLFAVLLGGAVALLPVYAREILNAGPWALGVLRAAPGVGAVAMALTLAHFPLKRHAGAAMLLGVSAFGVFTIIFGFSRNIVLSVAALILLGASDMVSVIVRITMIQLSTPDSMRGRVSAVNSIFVGASNEFGQFESGITAQWFGTVPAVVFGGIGTIIVAALWAWRFPMLRKIDELAAMKPNVIPASAESAQSATAQQS